MLAHIPFSFLIYRFGLYTARRGEVIQRIARLSHNANQEIGSFRELLFKRFYGFRKLNDDVYAMQTTLCERRNNIEKTVDETNNLI